MTERKLYWPEVKMDDVEPTWWDEVMNTTSPIQRLLDAGLSDEEEFTLRSIVHVIANKAPEVVSYIFEGSAHLDRFLEINKNLHSNEDTVRATGQEQLEELIDEYLEGENKDSLLGEE